MRTWKPSKSACREFAQNMQNSEFANAYYARKEAKADKRRATSKFDYDRAGGNYLPTKEQHNFCSQNMHLFATEEQLNAANMIMFGYSCSEKVSHDDIHVVNEIRRHQTQL